MATGRSSLAAALDSVFFNHSKTIFVDEFEIPASWSTFASYDHGSTRPYAWLAFAESDGTTLQFKNGRTMPTLPGDIFHCRRGLRLERHARQGHARKHRGNHHENSELQNPERMALSGRAATKQVARHDSSEISPTMPSVRR